MSRRPILGDIRRLIEVFRSQAPTLNDVVSRFFVNLNEMPPLRILFIFGTRPEAIKLCSVIRHVRDECDGRFDVRICVTAQHRDILDQVLELFGVEPHYDLNAMRPGQTLTSATSRILSELEPVLQSDRPDLVVVQGDTASTLSGAMAAFYAGIPIGHVEAGLRTG